MSEPTSNQNPNELRDILYSIARQERPDFVWQWFFRYFAGAGLEPERYFKNEPKLINFQLKTPFTHQNVCCQNIYCTLFIDYFVVFSEICFVYDANNLNTITTF